MELVGGRLRVTPRLIQGEEELRFCPQLITSSRLKQTTASRQTQGERDIQIWDILRPHYYFITRGSYSTLLHPLPFASYHITRDRSIIFIKLYFHTLSVGSADPAATASAQRDGHNAVDVRQHDGDADTWRGGRAELRRA